MQPGNPASGVPFVGFYWVLWGGLSAFMFFFFFLGGGFAGFFRIGCLGSYGFMGFVGAFYGVSRLVELLLRGVVGSAEF